MTLPDAPNSARSPAEDVPADPDRDGLAGGVRHLRRHGALPHQVVQALLVAGQAVPGHLLRRAEPVTGGPDGLVRLLGVLDLAGVDARLVRDVGVAVQLTRLVPGRVDRRLRQRGRVGPHIGDVAVLVQPLRHRHRVLGREAQLARGLLLQRGGAERGVRGPLERLALDGLDGEAGVLEPPGQLGRRRPVQVQHLAPLIIGAQLADRVEVPALGHPLAVHGDQGGVERTGSCVAGVAALARDGGELGLQIPVLGGAECDPVPLPVHDEPGGHGLDPPGRQPRHDLLPQHRRDLVPVQPVQHPARLVGVNQGLVQLPRVGHGRRDGFRGDLVEHHAPVRDLGLELFQQVPGDGLAFAVFIGGEQQFVGALEQILQLGDLLALVVRDDVQRLEVVVDVDPEPGPRLLAVLGRDLRGPVRHVADVSHAGLDHVARAQVAGDGARLGRRLDDHQPGTVTGLCGTARPGTARRGTGRLAARTFCCRRRCRPLGSAFTWWHARSNLTSAARSAQAGFRAGRTSSEDARPCRYIQTLIAALGVPHLRPAQPSARSGT